MTSPSSTHDPNQGHPAVLAIRKAAPTDWPEIWAILQPAFAAGDSYPCPIDMLEEDARAYWLAPGHAVYVATSGDDVSGGLLGTYYLRTDQGGLGDHICNCGFVVAETARGRGVAGAMCVHAEKTAREGGYLGMRFNLVVATNEAGVRAWEKAGFGIVGTVPKAFRHKDLGFVDAHVMFKWLAET